MPPIDPHRELVDALARPGHGEAFRTIAELLPAALGADRSVIYDFTSGEAGLELDTLQTRALDPALVREAISEGLARGERGWLAYTPALPEPAQRNRVLTRRELQRAGTPGVVTAFARRAGVDGEDLARLLVCDGPTLLAYVGVFRPEPFGAREKAALRALRTPLDARLRFDQQLAGARLHAAALEALLEALPEQAFLVRGTPRRFALSLANAPARQAWDRDRAATRERLRAALVGSSAPDVRVLRLSEQGLPEHTLVLRQPVREDRRAQLLAATRETWGLTRRQLDVLALVVLGRSNKAIALELRVAEVTVELHVTTLLAKARASSRAELIALFWTFDERRSGE